MRSDGGPDDALRRLAEVLAARPDVVTPRERELLALVVERFRPESAGDAHAALRRAIASALALRASEALGAAIADQILGKPEQRADVVPPPVFAEALQQNSAASQAERTPRYAAECEPARFDGISAEAWERVRASLDDRLGIAISDDSGEAAGAGGVVYRWSFVRDAGALTIAVVAKPVLMPCEALERRMADAVQPRDTERA